jgi:CheY-like chemotaxis protein
MSGDGRVSVLHVDDDPSVCSVVKAFFESSVDEVEYRVTTVTEPSLALERTRSERTAVDCVVSDFRMPSMDGLELLRAVRDSHPDLPFLLFSAEEPDHVAAELTRAGLTSHLRKGSRPDLYEELMTRVRHAVCDRNAPGRTAPGSD